MSSSKNHKSLFIPVALLALLVAGALFAIGLTGTVPAEAAPSGAIFTTLPDGSAVNANVQYTAKIEVYLDGGPPGNAPASAGGLDRDLYVFQITNPSGSILLSEDPSKCRIAEVSSDDVIVGLFAPSALATLTGAQEAAFGVSAANFATITDTYDHDDDSGTVERACQMDDDNLVLSEAFAGVSGQHDRNVDADHGAGTADDKSAVVLQMMPFFDTPNPGGVYKAWIVPLRTCINHATNIPGPDPSIVEALSESPDGACLRPNGRPANKCTPSGVQIGFKEDNGFMLLRTRSFRVWDAVTCVC